MQLVCRALPNSSARGMGNGDASNLLQAWAVIAHEGKYMYRVGLQMDLEVEVVSRKDREEQTHRVDWDRTDDCKN